MKTSPRLFLCFECPRAWRPLSLLLAPACSLCPSGVVGSPRLACRPSGRVAGRVAGRGLSCRRAVRWGLSLVARFPCRAAWRRAACLSLRGSSLVSILSAGG